MLLQLSRNTDTSPEPAQPEISGGRLKRSIDNDNQSYRVWLKQGEHPTTRTAQQSSLHILLYGNPTLRRTQCRGKPSTLRCDAQRLTWRNPRKSDRSLNMRQVIDNAGLKAGRGPPRCFASGRQGSAGSRSSAVPAPSQRDAHRRKGHERSCGTYTELSHPPLRRSA